MIEVYCVCGKLYTVPDDKAGKKLQCKRCGAITRIPRTSSGDDVVVPFQDPGTSTDDGDDDLLASVGPPPLDIRDPLRRCPSCGLQDESSVVLCVRCGFDFREGRRIEDAHEQSERSARVRAVEHAEGEVQRLASLSWLALSPLGLVLGPYLLARSFALEPHARVMGRDGRVLERVRGVAMLGLVLWIVTLGVLAVAVTRRSGSERERLDRECRARLERLGVQLAARVTEERRFPAAGVAWAAALERLTAPGSPDLVCPVGGDLYPFQRRATEVLTPQTEAHYLVLWDRELHADANGTLLLRALRFDGKLETFRVRGDLEQAIARPAFAVTTPPPGPRQGGAGETPPAPGGATERPPGRDADRARLALESFLAFAGGIDDSDPDFSQGVTVDPELFTERVGVPHDELLPALLAGKDAEVRAQAIRMLARLTIPRDAALRRAQPLAKDDVAEVRLGAALCLLRHADPRWLTVMAGVADDAAVEETRRVALLWIGREATKGPLEARQVLLAAAALRKRSAAPGANAVLPLPDAALEYAVGLLEDKEVRREAAATLFSGGEAGVRALVPVLVPERPRELRAAAFDVLDRLRVGGFFSLDDYLQRAAEELDPDVRAGAVASLARETGPPPLAVLDWVLEALRRGATGPLRALCEGVLERAGHGEGGAPALQRMLDDLTREGDSRGVLEALGRPARQRDERLDDMLARRWDKIPDVATRMAAANLLAARPHEGAQRALLVAVADPAEDVRIEALRGLRESIAVRGPEHRREAARVLGQRLRSEDSPRALEHLYALAGGGTYCETVEANDHRCATPIIRSLEQLVRKGDRGAMRALRGHPTEKVLDFLVTALEGTRDESLKQDMVGSLQALTGILMTSREGSEWRRLVSPPTPEVTTFLGEIMKVEARRLANLEERAKRRLEDLKATAGAPGER